MRSEFQKSPNQELIDELHEMTMNEIKRRTAQTNWISVKDRLPNFYQDVLLCVNVRGHVHVLYGQFNGFKQWDVPGVRGGFDLNEVTHWMPLPEPPKNEN